MQGECNIPYETNFQKIKQKLGLNAEQEHLSQLLFQQNNDIVLDKAKMQ